MDRVYEIKQGDTVIKRWIESRSPKRELRRASEKAVGTLSGRQWVKLRKQFRNLGRHG